MTDYVFSDIASNKSIRVRPSPGDEEHYIGLEHMSADSFEVDSYGSETELKGDKLAMSKGDLLFGRRRAYQRKVSIAPFDGIFSAHGMILEPNEKVVDKRFFPFFIRSDYFMDRAISLSVGSLSPTLNWSDIKKETFNLPDLQFQRDAAEVLWKLEELKKRLTNHLSTLDILIKSRFIEMFGKYFNSNEIVLADLCTSIDSGKSYTCGDPRTEVEPAILKLGAVFGGEYNPNENKVVDPDLFKEEFEVKPGDVLFSRKNTYELVGTAAYVWDTPPKLMLPDLIFRINLNDSVNPIYFVKLINHPLYRVRVTSLTHGAASSMPNISKKELLGLGVPLPPITEQNLFADFVRQVDKSKVVLLKHIEDTKSLQQSIINSCFEANEDV